MSLTYHLLLLNFLMPPILGCELTLFCAIMAYRLKGTKFHCYINCSRVKLIECHITMSQQAFLRNFLLYSWIKRDQLDVTCFIISLFTAQHVSDVNTSIDRSLRLICWVISWVVLLWCDVCWCYGVVWLGWCGIRMSRASACIRIPHHPSQTTP